MLSFSSQEEGGLSRSLAWPFHGPWFCLKFFHMGFSHVFRFWFFLFVVFTDFQGGKLCITAHRSVSDSGNLPLLGIFS